MQEQSYGTIKASFTSEAGRSTAQVKAKKTVGDTTTLLENMYIQALLLRTKDMDME